MALVPIQFRPLRAWPLSVRRSEFDQRLEQGAAYLDAATLGVDGIVLGDPGAFIMPNPIWSPGFTTFTLFLNSSSFPGLGGVFVVLEHLDPDTQAAAWGPTVAPALTIADDLAQVTNFGAGGSFSPYVGLPSTAAMLFVLWRMWVFNVGSGAPATISLELLANSRVTI